MSGKRCTPNTHSNQSPVLNDLVLHMLRGQRMPHIDGLLGHCDPYVKAWLRDESNINKHKDPCVWPVKPQSLAPVWNSCRSLGPAVGSDHVYLELWDHDTLTKDDFLGSSTIGVNVLMDALQGKLAGNSAKLVSSTSNVMAPVRTTPTTVIIKMKKQPKQSKFRLWKQKNKPFLEIGLVAQPSTLPVKKTLYLVRHGESVWNKAQSDLNVVELVSHTDHPLHKHGVQQAQALCSLIDKTDAHSASEMNFRAAQAILVSPLTRAIQTALVGLRPIIFAPSRKSILPTLKLAANAREKRNAGGRDSSGQAVGQEIRKRALETLKPNLSVEDWANSDFEKIVFDTLEVEVKWWIDHKEPEEDVQNRTSELMWQLRYMHESHIILVGHSHFFREIMQHFVSPGCVNPELAAKLKEKVIVNCGVMKLDLDFSGCDSFGKLQSVIHGVEFLFGTTLKDKEEKDKKEV
eukprot:c20399_g1_i1.p1 GENE.c20399_g1_i1~~c20399_g1_i1.p1  ORF type:complete len:461 (-),score=136.46 c20399_g1_i1:1402-2784(-)